MASPVRDPKTGIYLFRRAVPHDLRELVGKREEKRSLGTRDPEEAKRRYPAVAAEVEKKWASLRAGRHELTEREAHKLASRIHDNWLEMHRDNPSDQLIWHVGWFERLWTEPEPPEVLPDEIGIDVLGISAMRRFCLRQTDFCLEADGLVVDDRGRFRLAKAVGAAFQRASLTLQDVARGRTDPASFYATAPSVEERVATAPETPVQTTKRNSTLTMSALIERWWREASAAGRKPSTYESYKNTFRAFRSFLGHDNAHQVTAKDVVEFKDHRLATPSKRTGRKPSAKTVKDSDLSALKTIFGWALTNQLLPENVATRITIKLARPTKLRSKSFTDAEATRLLNNSLNYQPRNESLQTAAAKRWVPWLCAFTGARVGEMAQLRKQDITRDGEMWVIRITPEAGTVKNNEARLIVLHRQVVALGFPSFVAKCKDGHMFLRIKEDGDVSGPLQGLTNRLGEFARSVVSDPAVSPNHGWRHRFKTIGLEAGIDSRILDAIQGHAPSSEGRKYGDETLKTIALAIDRLPDYPIDPRHTASIQSLSAEFVA